MIDGSVELWKRFGMPVNHINIKTNWQLKQIKRRLLQENLCQENSHNNQLQNNHHKHQQDRKDHIHQKEVKLVQLKEDQPHAIMLLENQMMKQLKRTSKTSNLRTINFL